MKRIYILLLSSFLCIFIVSMCLTDNFDDSKTVVSSENISKRYPTIVLDSGHGGEDGGATSLLGDYEKDINLDICLTLEKLLIQGGYNVKTIRNTDISVHDDSAKTTRERKVSDIHNRVKIANSDKNNILVSIHQNHFSESKYFGTQVFYSKNSANSQILAENIREAVTSLLQPENTRKCKESSDVYLLDNVTVPAVIVECGFLSNYDEAYLLSKADYRDNMAYSIYLGIVEYIYLNY
ncbi:MAG: N-acetylmuramoyl-L-alanine amidase [Clostridia bacterium]|nr:N-acetylmuramoyl-L-alanine amidase [Clostridia bacterium]